MKYRSVIPALIAALLVSCNDGTEFSIEPEGYVAGSEELDGRVNAVEEKSLYPAMEMAVMSGGFSRLGPLYEDEPWFVLEDGDRIKLLETDEDEPIARVEVLSGPRTGTTCWVSVECVKFD